MLDLHRPPNPHAFLCISQLYMLINLSQAIRITVRGAGAHRNTCAAEQPEVHVSDLRGQVCESFRAQGSHQAGSRQSRGCRRG